MNQILYSKKSEQKIKILAIIFCTLLVLLIIVSISFGIANQTNDKILRGVSINNLSVEELTMEQARTHLNDELQRLSKNEIILVLDGYTKKITGEDIGISFSDSVLEEAYNYGRTGNLLANNYTVLFSYLNKKHEISTDLLIDESKYQSLLEELHNEVGTIVKDDSYTITDNKIELEKGIEGKQIKEQELKDMLLASIVNTGAEIEIPVEKGLPKRVDFDKLYDEIYVEKVNASYEMGETFEVTKEVYGVEFNKEEAIQQYTALNDGEKMEIALISVEPDIKVSDLNDALFKDVLSTYQTKYDKYYTNRVRNLELAAEKINGTILYPGEEFSYNKVVGERTSANGFKAAHVFAGGKVVDGLGGGICQISTTLYNTVLLSNLEVTERKAHMMHTGYVDPGRDATVVYGAIDFRFKNNRKTPIKIEMTVKDGIATSTIYGLKEADEPTVEIKTVILKTIPYQTVNENDPTMNEGTTKVVQSPVNGYVSETYKIIKNAAGEEISNTLVSKDSYQQTSKIVKVGTKKVAVEPETPPAPVEPTPTEPTTPTNPTPDTNSGSSLPTGWDNPESPYAGGGQ